MCVPACINSDFQAHTVIKKRGNDTFELIFILIVFFFRSLSHSRSMRHQSLCAILPAINSFFFSSVEPILFAH